MEKIYFVNENDQPTGEVSEKLAAHHSQTKLHAAFSCYIFNRQGEFLVTKRADEKKVWPEVWTNSCCGHPEPGESREMAIQRRVADELGIHVSEIHCILEQYIYKTPEYRGVVEHEFCPIYVAVTDDEPKPNPAEVSEYQWVEWDWYVNELEHDADDYTTGKPSSAKWSWWAKDQLKKLREASKG